VGEGIGKMNVSFGEIAFLFVLTQALIGVVGFVIVRCVEDLRDEIIRKLSRTRRKPDYDIDY
jgi:hypothetical protein